MSISGEEKESSECIDEVVRIVEACLRHYMTRESIINTLHVDAKIDRGVIDVVLQRLERENKEFFKAYQLRIAVRDQIVAFNRLLDEQVDLMHRTSLAAAASIPLSNGAHNLPLHEAYGYGPGQTAHSFWLEGTHQPLGSSFADAYTNCGPSLHPDMQTAVDMAAHAEEVDVPPNTMLPRILNTRTMQGINGRMIIPEGGHVGDTAYVFRADSNARQVHPAIIDASVSSFSSVESNSQLPNETFMDADASSFGFQGQNPRTMLMPSGVPVDFSKNAETAAERALMSSFAMEDKCNLMDPHDWGQQ